MFTVVVPLRLMRNYILGIFWNDGSLSGSCTVKGGRAAFKRRFVPLFTQIGLRRRDVGRGLEIRSEAGGILKVSPLRDDNLNGKRRRRFVLCVRLIRGFGRF